LSTLAITTLLRGVVDLGVLVLQPREARLEQDALLDAWRDAHDEATAAYRRWQGDFSAEARDAYRAAQDRADAAQDVLAQRSRGRLGPPIGMSTASPPDQRGPIP
jgi:hypothetical protein